MDKSQLSKFYGKCPEPISKEDGKLPFPLINPACLAGNFENDNKILNVICRDDDGNFIDPMEFKLSPTADPMLQRVVQSLLSRMPDNYCELTLEQSLDIPVSRSSQYGSEVEQRFQRMSELLHSSVENSKQNSD